MEVKQYILEEESYITGLRRHFHQHPERSLEEFRTAEKIESELDDSGIEHQRVGNTGVIGFIRGTKGTSKKTVALRADTDALPITEKNNVSYKSENEGTMHACGHDAHTASLLGAARVLKGKEAEFSGEIRLFFQQAEEIGQGARQFIEAGHLDGVAAILGTHVASPIPVGMVAVSPGATNASCDYFKITVTGKSAHVSTPHLGIDAVYIASLIVVSLQSIVSRETNPLDTVVVGVGVIKGGTNYNIIANEAVIEGTTRSFSRETRAKTNDAVRRIAKGIADSQGASADIYFESYAAPLVNDEATTVRAQKIAAAIVGEKNVITAIPKSLGADDFADYLERVPGVYAMIGTRNTENPSTAAPHHNENFDIDEKGLLVEANLYVDFALDFLTETPAAR